MMESLKDQRENKIVHRENHTEEGRRRTMEEDLIILCMSNEDSRTMKRARKALT